MSAARRAAVLSVLAALPARAWALRCGEKLYTDTVRECRKPVEDSIKDQWRKGLCVKMAMGLSRDCSKAYAEAREAVRKSKTRDELTRTRRSLAELDARLDGMSPIQSAEVRESIGNNPIFALMAYPILPGLGRMREDAETDYRRKLAAIRAAEAKRGAKGKDETPTAGGEGEEGPPSVPAPTAAEDRKVDDAMEKVAGLLGDADADPAGAGGPATPKERAAVVSGVRDQERFLGRLAPKDAAVLSEVGESYLRAGSPADSERVLDRAVALAPADPEALARRAAARAVQGKLEEAVADAKAAMERDPHNETAARVLSYASLAKPKVDFKGNLDKPGFGALPAPDQGGAGGSAAAGVGAGGARAGASGGYAGGGAASAGGTRAGRVPVQDLLQAASRKLALGDLSGALFEASRAILAAPKDARGWALRAAISNKLKNHKAALKDADEALRLDPDNAAALLERGYARYQLGDYASALEDFERAVALEPRNAMGLLYRAMAFEKLGRLEEAARDYEAAAALDPALEPLSAEALARLRPRPAPPPAAARPARALLWSLSGMIAALLVLTGLRRVFKPGWRTTRAPVHHDEGRAPHASAAGTLAPGAILAGNFRIEAELARGGMGVVYQGTDLTLRRSVAVKQMRREAWESAAARQRFLKEARLAARLKHPHLAQILSVVSEGELILIFELLEGETLERHLSRRGRLGLNEAAGLVRDIGSAVDYAHDQKVIHRDLKPSNVMLCRDGGLKVMDFGIAHEARTGSGLTQTAAWGTPPYMAPEAEQGKVGKPSDLYALGLIAYELLTGSRPFDGPGMQADKLRGEFVLATALEPALPRGADPFFAKALDPEPGRRFSSAKELHAALARLS